MIGILNTYTRPGRKALSLIREILYQSNCKRKRRGYVFVLRKSSKFVKMDRGALWTIESSLIGLAVLFDFFQSFKKIFCFFQVRLNFFVGRVYIDHQFPFFYG